MTDYYGYDKVREAVKKIPYLDDQDIAFVCTKFSLAETDLLCYTRKQLNPVPFR